MSEGLKFFILGRLTIMRLQGLWRELMFRWMGNCMEGNENFSNIYIYIVEDNGYFKKR